MRLALFWPAQVYESPEGYLADGYAHQWFGPLAEHFSEVDLIARRSPRPSGVARIDTSHLRVHLLPPVDAGWQTYSTRFPRILIAMISLVFRRRHDWDVVLIYEVGPLAQVLYRLCKVARLPVVLYLGGRHEQAVVLRARGRGRIPMLLARIWSRWCRFEIPRMVRDTPTVVTGSELEDFYRSASRHGLYNVTSSSVREHQVVDKAPSRPVGGETDGSPVLLTVCSLSPVKGVEYLIGAAQSLIEQGQSVTVRIVGSGRETYVRYLRQVAAAGGIASSVEFVGAVSPGPALLALYDSASVFILPSITEGTPKVVLEAMSRGIPVIASNVGGIPELITDGRTGILVPPGDQDALASAIQRMLARPEVANQIATEALRWVRGVTTEAQTARLAAIIKGNQGCSAERAATTNSNGQGAPQAGKGGSNVTSPAEAIDSD